MLDNFIYKYHYRCYEETLRQLAFWFCASPNRFYLPGKCHSRFRRYIKSDSAHLSLIIFYQFFLYLLSIFHLIYWLLMHSKKHTNAFRAWYLVSESWRELLFRNYINELETLKTAIENVLDHKLSTRTAAKSSMHQGKLVKAIYLVNIQNHLVKKRVCQYYTNKKFRIEF